MISYEEAIKQLTRKDNFYIDFGLNRISQALEKLGNPQDSIKCIQVAGTNGKGSVCTMLAGIFQEAGYKTGLYTSPHIWEYTERIKINGKDILKEKFAEYVQKIINTGIHLTEFEILTAMMFLYFKEQSVDIAIIETGMGGRLDATNVIKTNICSIITQIDYDHTDYLGDTKEKIASEKAGIIKPNCPIVTSMGFEAIRDRADECNSLLIMVSPHVSNEYMKALTLKGMHQIDNLALVITTIHELFKNIDDNIVVEGLRKVKNPCRFKYIKEKNLIIDACHNPNGAEALRNNLDLYYPNQDRRFIFGALKTKDYKKMMNILFRESDEIYLNGFNYPKALSFEELKNSCPFKANKFEALDVIKSDKLNIICGSFYMIGGMKQLKELFN